MNHMKKSKAETQKLSVYYDGLCRACSFEIEHYKKQKGSENIDFIDITSPLFKPEAEGLDPFLVHKYLHAKTPDGRIVSGVETFQLIWKELPKYNWAYQLSQKKLIHYGLNIGYQLFVRIRPYLPRKKDNCENSPYCEVHQP
jgi:predicted DCC family thiol-disulfide oxidoreductase YuxK